MNDIFEGNYKFADTDIEGVFRRLMYGFGAAGPFTDPTDRQGSRLPDQSILAYLRALLSLQLFRTGDLNVSIDVPDLAFDYSGFLNVHLEASRTSVHISPPFDATLSPGENRRRGYRTGTTYLFGIGNVLDALCNAHFAREFTRYDAEDFIVTASEWIENALVSHPKRELFLLVGDGRKLSEYPSGTIPLAAELTENLTKFLASDKVWSFWLEWYQGFLDGRLLDRELQSRIALIEGTIWDAGPEAVADEIERIQAFFKLEQEIATLKEQLAATATSTSTMIGDNGGPPLDDAVALMLQKDIQLVREQVTKLEAEIAKPDPSRSVLNGIAHRLLDISKRIAAYCGEKLDLVLTEAAKASGKTLGTVGTGVAITAISAQNESILSVANAIKDFALTLVGG